MSITDFSLPGCKVIQVEEGDDAYRLTVMHAAPEALCPYCGAVAFRYGRIQQFYADTPIQGKHVGLLIHKQRYRCRKCRKTFMEVFPEMDEVRSMTRRLRVYIEQQALRRSFISVADEVGVHEKTVRTIFREYFTSQGKGKSTAQATFSKTIHEFVLERSRRERSRAKCRLCEQPNWYHYLQDEQHTHIFEELRKRYAIACQIAEVLSTHTAILSILVFGAAARGHVDEHSTMDFLILCKPGIVSLLERKQLLIPIGVTWTLSNHVQDNPLFVETDSGELTAERVRINLHYQTTSWISNALRDVLVRGAITTKPTFTRPYTLPAFLQAGWLLYDKKKGVQKWRKCMATFPRELKRHILEHFLPRLHQNQEEVERVVKLDLGPWLFLHYLNEVGDALISILFALNEVYEPGDRQVAYEMLLTLRRVPKDFVTNFTGVFVGPFDDKGAVHRAQLLQSLITETVEMAKLELI